MMKAEHSEIEELKRQNREILHELALIEDILKTLLVNNVLDDADRLLDMKKPESKKAPEEPAFGIDDSASKMIEELKGDVEYLESKLRNMIGRKVFIRQDCNEFYDENKEPTTLSNNLRKNIFNNHWDFTIEDYDYGMFLLTRKSIKLWVPFDMTGGY